jgi:hypothetical protein
VKLAITLLIAIAGCSVHHASDSFKCETTANCEQGRICDNGFCVLAGSIDAPKPIDARMGDGGNNGCPPGCTTCSVQQKTCTINCLMGANCNNTVTCPAGYKCEILCNSDNSCRNGVNCQLGASCSVECSGKSSCQGVSCGAGPCDVACSGTQSCRGVACGNSCACDVTCTGNQACEGIVCTSLACRTTTKGCTSEPALCHSCQ